MFFCVRYQDLETHARTGELSTVHGTIQTPVFMPVGTRAGVKAMSPNELYELNSEVILSNTYHLSIRPGVDIIQSAGGLHQFMGWNRAILTDSGGYQVFSLAKLRKVSDKGVEFQSHLDGSALFLGPSEAMSIQKALGSDIAMVFDECPPYPCEYKKAQISLERTLRWAAECCAHDRAQGQCYFGIIQGAMYQDLREKCAQSLMEMDFDGYALGGLSVGEPEELMFRVTDWIAPHLPDKKPRYLMGVGTPPQIIEAVARGIDMFDCVLPTRVARNGCAYTASGMKQIKGGRYKKDFTPIEDGCTCYACKNFTKAYIRHLLNVGEILGLRLVTMHNLHFYQKLMKRIRKTIKEGSFNMFRQKFLNGYSKPQRASKLSEL